MRQPAMIILFTVMFLILMGFILALGIISIKLLLKVEDRIDEKTDEDSVGI